MYFSSLFHSHVVINCDVKATPLFYTSHFATDKEIVQFRRWSSNLGGKLGVFTTLSLFVLRHNNTMNNVVLNNVIYKKITNYKLPVTVYILAGTVSALVVNAWIMVG